MRIAQISDVHFTHFTLNPFRFRSKRLAGMANWLFFRKNWFCHEPLYTLPEELKKLGVDLLLVGGDLTSTSLPKEFRLAQRFFDTISIPKLFVPGNHDKYTRGSQTKKRFYQFFSNRNLHPHALNNYTLAEHGVEAHPIHHSTWCVALDTTLATSLVSSNGLFSPAIEKTFIEVLQQIPKNDKIILLNHFPLFENDQSLHRMIRSEALRSIIASYPNIILYLHGHTHRHIIADLRPNDLCVFVDGGCPIQKRQSTWNLIDIQENLYHIQGFQWMNGRWEVFRNTKLDL